MQSDKTIWHSRENTVGPSHISRSSLNKTKGISQEITVWKGAMNVSCHPVTDIKAINIECKEEKALVWSLESKDSGREKGEEAGNYEQGSSFDGLLY